MIRGKNLYITRALRCMEGLLPRRCCLCHRSTSAHSGFCSACWHDLPRHSTRCRQCAIDLSPNELEPLCGRCLYDSPQFDQSHAALSYQRPIDSLVAQFKYDAREYLAKPLASMMLAAKPQRIPDLMLPVPMHPKRERQRGGNHTVLLAKSLHAHTRWPLALRGARRKKHTQNQVGMSREQRQHNVIDAFEVTQDVSGLHCLVIDDVMTTGSTLNALACALKNAGAARVDTWVIARARAR